MSLGLVEYCASVCASWLGLPEDDRELLDILLRYLPEGAAVDHKAGKFTSRIIDAGDDTGDGILELPDALMAELGWREEDLLDVSMNETGCLIVRRAEEKVINIQLGMDTS